MARVEHSPFPVDEVEASDLVSEWETRLTRLEQANQTWRTAALGLGALLIGLVAMREAGVLLRGGVLEAREFRLVDSKGATRAVLGMQSNDLPALDLLDGRGEALAMLRVTDDTGAALTLRQPDQGHQVLLESSPLATQLMMIGPDNQPTVGLYRHQEETGLILSGSEQTQHWSMGPEDLKLARRDSEAKSSRAHPETARQSPLLNSASGDPATTTSPVKPISWRIEERDPDLAPVDPRKASRATPRRPI